MTNVLLAIIAISSVALLLVNYLGLLNQRASIRNQEESMRLSAVYQERIKNAIPVMLHDSVREAVDEFKRTGPIFDDQLVAPEKKDPHS